MWKTKRIEDLVINDNYDSFDFEKFFDLSPDLLCVAGYDGYLKKNKSGSIIRLHK
jgi:hypothetical protein